MPKDQKSKLDAFADELDQWFGVEKITLAAARDRLIAQGCEASIGALSNWWEKRQSAHLQERILTQISTGSQACRDIDRQFEKNPEPKLETLIKLVKVLVLKTSAQANAEPEMIEQLSYFMGMVLDFSKLQKKGEEISLALEKFQRETCELFIKWYADKRATEIVDGGATNSDKIKALHQLMFGNILPKTTEVAR